MDFREVLKSELYTSFPTTQSSWWAELVGILRGGGVIEKREGKILLSLRHRDLALIKKCLVLAKKFYPGIAHTLTEQERRGINSGLIYLLDFAVDDEEMLTALGFKSVVPLLDLLSENGSFLLRGIFETRGYMTEPARGYHLEIPLMSEELAWALLKYLEKQEMSFRLRHFRGEFRLYTKNARSIGIFLAHIGASQSYLLLEKLLVEKLTLDELTRWVNYATSNLERVVESSLRHRQKIAHLDLEGLPSSLRQVAYLRLRYPYASLREIGERCTPPLSKMEVFRRLKKIEKWGES